MLHDYTLITEANPDFAKNGPEAFIKARLIVFSRSFGLQMDKKQICMVPFGDMLNHAVPSMINCEFRFDQAKQVFIVEAIRPIK